MFCPNCSNILISHNTPPVEVDVCLKCKGIWFDDGEIGDFVNLLCKNEKVKPVKRQLYKRREVNKVNALLEKPRSCPKCKVQMKKINYAYDSNVVLDKCPDCNGIWADAGESKLIASYLKDDPRFAKVAAIILESSTDLSEVIEDEIAADVVKGFLFWPRMVIPISDDVERQKLPVMTISLILISVLIYLSQMLVNPYWLLETLDLLPQNIVDAYKFDTLGTIFSQGGFWHLAWNMLFLWLFGDNIEDKFSRFSYLVFFIFCGAMSLGIYSLMVNDLPASAIGIGGAVSGVMGAYLIYYPAANLNFFVAGGVRQVPAVLCFATWFIFQLLYPYFFQTNRSLTSICFAHIGGFVLGICIASFKKIKEGQ